MKTSSNPLLSSSLLKDIEINIGWIIDNTKYLNPLCSICDTDVIVEWHYILIREINLIHLVVCLISIGMMLLS